MNVLFVASESVPFIKTGGLADVIGSLPKELNKHGVQARVILPKYSDIPAEWKKKMKPKATCTVWVGWRRQYCGIEEAIVDGVHYYFVDNEYYFNRNGLYGHYDDGERFAYFCRAVLEALPLLDFDPDILHCHDWHTGMVSVMLKAHYGHIPYYQRIRTVFTIHNLKYQGVFPYSILNDLLGLGDSWFTSDKLEFYGGVSFMKGALVYSDLLTTVSKTYAQEIQTSYFGEQLDGLLRARGHSLTGIVNGIDYDLYNPETDPHLVNNYRDPAGKKPNKAALQAQLGLPVQPDVPIISIVSRLVEQKGLDLIAHVLEQMFSLDVQFVVLGTGDFAYENLFRNMMHHHPDQVSAHILFNEELARRIYAGSDLFLMPSQFEPCGIGQLISLRYGTVPIVRETGGLKDTVQPYNKYTGEGNGFSFANYNAHEMLAAVERAVDLYHHKPLWNTLTNNARLKDYSWNESARRYTQLYQTL
jgi:starch synthase